MNLLQQIFLLENLSKTETVRKERDYRKEDQKILLTNIYLELRNANQGLPENELKDKLLNIEKLLSQDIGELTILFKELIYYNLTKNYW